MIIVTMNWVGFKSLQSSFLDQRPGKVVIQTHIHMLAIEYKKHTMC